MSKVFKIIFFLLLSSVVFSDPVDSRLLHGKKKIVIIHSYLAGEWFYGINKSFENGLRSFGFKATIIPYVYHSAFWDQQSIQLRQKEKNKILKFIKKNSPDLVLVCDDEASDLLMQDLYHNKIPTLFTGINRRPELISWMKSIPKEFLAGVLETYPIEQSLSVLEKIKPKAKNISILSSTIATSKIAAENISLLMKSTEQKSKHGLNLRKTYLLQRWEEWKEAINEIKNNDDALWVLVPYDVLDKNNKEMNIEAMGSYLKEHLTIPTLGIIGIHTKIGLFSAINIGPEALGRQAAEQAGMYFNGVSLFQIGVQDSKYTQFEINLNEAKRLKIGIPPEFMGVAHFVEKEGLEYGR